jgi:hypothetical protein
VKVLALGLLRRRKYNSSFFLKISGFVKSYSLSDMYLRTYCNMKDIGY